MRGCNSWETELVKMSRSHEGQAELLILQAIGHTASGWFKAGRDSRSGSEQQPFKVAPWVPAGMRAGAKRKSWKKLTRADLMHVATRGGKDKGKGKQLKNRVDLALRWIKKAQAAGKTQVVPQLDKLMRMIPNPSDAPNSESLLTAADLREMFVRRKQFMTLDTGLFIAKSTIQGAGNGLYTSVHIPKGANVTFYDGVGIIMTEKDERQHWARRGWFIAVGHNSDTMGPIAGFTSADQPLPKNAGVISLMNSSKRGNCCEKVVEDATRILIIGGQQVLRVPTVKASRDIQPGEELLWNYENARTRLERFDAKRRQAAVCSARQVLLGVADRSSPLSVLNKDVLKMVMHHYAQYKP